MPPGPEPRPLCILSIGRSGTSLAARAVQLLGVDLGPEDEMLPASDWNPRGFWEQQAIVELNDAVLAAIGGSYWEPPAPAPGWEEAPALDPLRERARSLVDELFDRSGRWGFKDPRTALTLPFWRTVVGEMDYVICVRDPLEVAASLQTRAAGHDTAHYLRMWLRANAVALEQTQGRRRAIVLYDEWFRDGRRVAEQLAELVHGSATALDDGTWGRVAAVVEPGLHRQRTSPAGPPLHEQVPVEVAAMWLLLRMLAQAPASGPDGLHSDAAALAAPLFAAYEARRVTGDRLAAGEQQVEALAGALATMRDSRSWRVTAPLRAARERLRRARR